MEEEEIERLNKIEELHQILARLRELKKEGKYEDIEDKIAEVKDTLQQYMEKVHDTAPDWEKI